MRHFGRTSALAPWTTRLAIGLAVSVGAAGARADEFRLADRTEWRDISIVELNKQAPFATHFPYTSVAAALNNDPKASGRYLDLDGQWSFKWAEDPAHAPSGFWNKGADLTGWGKIPVPGDWVRSGYGHYAYVDEDYTFPMNVPNPPEKDNPVGSYVKEIDIPADWAGQKIFLHFGSVRTAFYVWVNGQLVGYSEDSRLPAEFDITKLAHPGRNRVAFQAIQWPDGAYLEDQDMWRMGGVERDVYAYAAPQTRIRDLFVRASLDPSYKDGLLDVDIEVDGADASAETLSMTLKDGATDALSEVTLTPSGKPGHFTYKGRLTGVRTWSAETPNLYTALFQLKDHAGKLVEATTTKVGFRNVELRGGQLLVNGKPIFIKGVNRQEFEADTMHVISREMQRRDLELMKQYNINAIRLSHAPNDEYLYELADQYGFYIVDEANIESHGAMNAHDMLADRPEFWNAHHSRMVGMVERDKNHPSVIIWSLGNEAGTGDAFRENYKWTHARDGSRPVQYEAAGNSDYTDIYVPMYAKVWDIQKYLVSKPAKPLIMCEFAHMMGNSGGALKTYRELFYQNPQFQGGFIWDWVDQSLKVTRPDGVVFYGYGGDFVKDNIEFSFADGLMSSLRQPHPQALELKKAFEPITITAPNLMRGEVHFVSHYDFADTHNLAYTWRLERNGAVVATGALDVPVMPARTETDAAIALPDYNPHDGEYFLTVEAHARQTDGLIPAGHLVAFEQFALPSAPRAAGPDAATSAPLRLEDGASALTVSGDGFAAVFDKASGELTQLRAGGKDLLAGGLRPHFWRAMTDNDLGADLDKRLALWREAGDKAKLVSLDHAATLDGGVTVTARYDIADGAARLTLDQAVSPAGVVRVDFHFEALKPDLPFIPRMGMRLATPAAFDRIQWFGRGPQANYADRNASAPVGLYGGAVKDQYDVYVRPQESGNKTDMRFMAVRQGQDGAGLLIVGDPSFSGGALPYTTEDLDQLDANQKHSADVIARPFSEIHVDLKQMGLGGDDSWRSSAHAQFLIWPKDYHYRFALVPLAAKADAGVSARAIGWAHP